MPKKREFDQNHPLWEEFVRLRQQGEFVHNLVRLSQDRGHPLSFKQITRGLQAAQYVKHLPNRTSHWLQKKVSEIDSKIDSLDSMHGLAALSAEKLLDLQRQLADPELPYARKSFLEKQEKEERRMLWQFCRDIFDREVQLGLRESSNPLAKQAIPPSKMDVVALAEQLVNLFEHGRVTVREVSVEGGKLAVPSKEVVSPTFMLKQLGNVRDPGDEIIVDGQTWEEPANLEEQV